MRTELLPHLETFCQAAETSSFTAAAQALGLTQAAISQRIQALEKSLGVPVFRRQGGRVLLTDAGQQLYRYGQRILALHEEARAEISGRRTPVTGELTLAASTIPGEHLLPAILSTLRNRYPHIQVRATVTDSSAVLQAVEHGHANLGLVGRKDDNPHLEFRSFACDQLVLVVPAEHPWAKRVRVSLKELYTQPLILREAGSGLRWCLEQALAEAGKAASKLQVTLELGSNEAIKDAVQRGMGLAVLSTHSIEQELTAGKLHAVAITGLKLARDIFAVWDRRRVLPIPARLFLDLLGFCPDRPGPA
jgi:LysR family transcriptional regulator, low CO2-responsive transcriptional regulator